jgi:phosphopantothenoylcysteine decarboxylase / phosphopantothenate---cysteine ligase
VKLVASPSMIRVGFAAETNDLLANAKEKLDKKGLDLIVANKVPSAFGSDTNQVVLIARSGEVDELPEMPKSMIAERIIEKIDGLLFAKTSKGKR